MSTSAHTGRVYDDPASPPHLCLNCGTALRGPYCAGCGQHDVDYHRSFHHLTHDLLENFFHFEGKFFTSVAWLLAKPGKLTAEFNAGRRQSQFNPLRFYIFVTVLFFLGVHVLNHGHLLAIDRSKGEQVSTRIQQIAQATKNVGRLSDPQADRFGKLLGDALSRTNVPLDDHTVAEIIAQVRREIPDDSSVAASGKPATNALRSRADRGEEGRFTRALKHKIEAGELTFSKILDEIETRVPTLLFLGMPVFALLLKLLYWRSGRYYIEHLIFSIHLHTWAFLVFMVSLGYFNLAALGPVVLKRCLVVGLGLWMMWYLLSAFRTVYRQSWVKTGVKLILLGGAYLISIFGLTLLITIGTVAWLVLA